MKKQSFYDKFSGYYDVFHSEKNYEKEVKKISRLIQRYKKSEGLDLLDVACGTGRHLNYFKKQFVCTGIDINKPMINVAKRKVKNVRFLCADMIRFSLNEKFDAITCLYASIAYVKTVPLLSKAIKNFANHLKSGGVLIIEPYWTLEQFKKRPNNFHIENFKGKNVKIARVNIKTLKKDLLIRDKITIIAEGNKEVQCFDDKRITGLFRQKDILKAMERANLEAKFIKRGLNYDWGLYIGVKKSV